MSVKAALENDLGFWAPRLLRYARALISGRPGPCAAAAGLMHTVLSQALDRDYPSRLTGGILELELYALLTKANRERLAGKLQAKAPGECQTFGACGQCAGEKLPVSSASSCEAWPSLLRLPLEEREALLLVALEGLSYSQACHVLRISRGILIARLARARGALSETAMKRSPFTPSKARPPYLRLVK